MVYSTPPTALGTTTVTITAEAAGDTTITIGDTTYSISVSATHTHVYESTVTTAATCTTPGVMTYTCDCGYSYTEEIPATGHVNTEIVGATKPTLCAPGNTGNTVCECGVVISAGTEITELVVATVLNGDKLVAVNGCEYVFDGDSFVHIAADGTTYYVKPAGGASTQIPQTTEESTITLTWQDNGTVWIGGNGSLHIWNNADMPYWDKCGSGHGDQSNGTHNLYLFRATGDTDGEIPGYTQVTSAEGMVSGESYLIAAKKGDAAWYVMRPSASSEKFDHIALVSSELRTTDHSYEPVVTDATCTEGGYTTYTCSSCGDTYTDAHTEALGHTPAEAVVENNVDATCTAAGSYDSVVYCSVCDAEISRTTVTVPVTDHTPGEAVIENEVDATLNNDGSYDEVVYCSVCDAELSRETVIVPALTGAVAAIDGYNYATLAAAVEAAAAGDTVTLLVDASGAGVVIDKDITIDLGGYTYSVTSGVGSTGTETNGFQLLQGNEVTIMNGTLAVAEEFADSSAMLIQNYADLTLADVTLNGTDSNVMRYVLSNNSGDVVITGNSIITAPEGAVAFDVYDYSYAGYSLPVVTVADTVVINGEIEAVAKVGNAYYATFDAALAAAKAGDSNVVTLWNEEGITITTDTTYDLSDLTVESEGDVFVVTAGTLTLNGNGVVKGGTSGVGSWTAVWANGGNVVINDGTYSVGDDANTTGTHQNDVIYTKNGGTVVIKGGTFLNNGNVWTLNQHDTTGGKITVYGGTFQNWNPADNDSEGEGNSFLAEGYCAAEQNGYYTVQTHAYTSVVTAPTCTEQGYTTYTCSFCGDSYVADEVAALGHTAGAAVRENEVAPTLNTTGSYDEVVYCSVCDAELSRETVIVPALSGAVAEVNGTKYDSFEAALAAAEAGDTIVLLAPVTVTADTTYDLSGLTVESEGDVFVVTAGTLTLNGNGVVKGGTSGVGSWTAVWANGGHVVINGGTYSVGDDANTTGTHQNDVIYTKNGGTVVINGGTFLNNGNVWTLNQNDTNGGKITVYGGTFQNWNPADNNSEGAGNSFLAEGYCAAEQNGYYTVQAHAYTSVVTAPTCTEQGYTTYTCSFCGDSYVADEVAALGHTEEIIPAVEATCTETGLTEGKRCSVCGEVLVAQEVVEALGHTEVVDAAVAATCTEAGLTEGKHCSVCNEVLVAQEVVEALGHTEVIDAAVAPTCTEAGLTEGKHCSVCNEVLVAQEVVDALGHTEVIDAAVAATCTEAGLTEGKHCSVCNEVLAAQEVVPALGHNYVDGTCVNCGEADPNYVTLVASGWSGYTTWKLTSDGVLTFTPSDQQEGGQTNLKNYWKVNGILTLPWSDYADMITKVVIEDGIHDIGQMAFYQLPNLTTVELGKDVTEIRNYAFKNCAKLTTINLENVDFIREGAFYGCSALENITLADGVVIEEWAFSKVPGYNP